MLIKDGSTRSCQEELMTRNVLKGAVMLAGAILFCSVIALAAKPQTVKVYYDSILPNGQTLKAGVYTVKVDESVHKVQFLRKGKVIAEGPCNCIAGEKNPETTCLYGKDKDGKQVLKEVRIEGDTRQIVMEGSGI
jgi:hypothetical protein